MLAPALLGAIDNSDHAERRNLVVADDRLADEPWYDGLGEVRGIHLIATTGGAGTEYRLSSDPQRDPRIAVPEDRNVIRAERLEYRLSIRDTDGGARQTHFATSHHFALSSQKDSTESDNVAFAPDDDMNPDHMASRGAETCYHPDEDLCDQCGALEERYREALKRRCRAKLCTQAEAPRRLARDARRPAAAERRAPWRRRDDKDRARPRLRRSHRGPHGRRPGRPRRRHRDAGRRPLTRHDQPRTPIPAKGRSNM